MGAAPPILQGQVNHKFDTGIHSLQLSELEREQRRAPRVVDDPPPSYDSTTAQRDTTSSHVEEMTRTSSRDSCASKKRRSRHNSGDITGSSAGRGLEPPSTPRRASKRKRTTRDRPGLVPVDVDLDAILNECDDPIARECTHRNHASASISRPIKSASAATPYSFEAPAMSFINLESDTETSTGAPGTTGVRREEETADTDLKTAVHQNISETRYHPAKTLDSSESDKPPASSKPMVGVRFWIIKARLPRFVSEKWVDGKLQGKSLDSVLEGVSNISGSTRIKELRFTLETADSERTYTIANDAEDEFEEMKQQFSTDMRAAFRKNRNEFKDFEIMIEPIDGEDLAKDGEAEVEDAVMGDW
ncbi:hypothetical protein MMC16_002112 [Acarospora aff. strigata]|nr:hypothetical protein [Acarospora aff. strigata]